jgi:hypothetical protein
VTAHLLSRLGAALLAAGVLGCGGEGGTDAPVTQPCPIGDMSAPPELEIVHLDAQNAVISTQPMQIVPLMQPPQGGWIVLLGARARNIDGCRLMVTAALIDGCNGEIIDLDRRPTMLVEGSDGWGVSSATTFANLPVCPHPTATRDLNEVPYRMQVVVEDDDGRKATTELTLVPKCPANAPMCNCQCARDYTLGSDCSRPPEPHGSCPGAATISAD